MRVIAGKARGITLCAPAGLHTRPTPARAKEGVFSMLHTRLPHARFLDLYCGSGAIGIEAASRGAQEVVFVDNAPAALAALRKNLAKTRICGAVVDGSAQTVTRKFLRQKRMFDIVFLDPPYAQPAAQTLVGLADILAAGGIVVLETDAHMPSGVAPAAHGLRLDGVRKFGRAQFMFFSADAHFGGLL